MKSVNSTGLFRRALRALFTATLAMGVVVVPLNRALAQAPNPATEGDDEDGNESGTEINVKNAELAAIVKIFSRKTKRNYILDDRVKGKVSIYLPGKVSSDESLRILDSVLAFKGFTSVPIGENLWKIVPGKDARQTTIPTIIKDQHGEPSAAMVTRLLHLKFVSADEMKQLLTPLISPDGLINAYTGTNSLIIIDNQDNIVRLENMIATLDVPFSDREMTIIPVVHADAVDIAEKLNDILGEGSSDNGGSNSSGSAPRGRLSGGRASNVSIPNAPNNGLPLVPGIPPPGMMNASTVASRGREPKIIADERTNSIIIVADDDTTARIRALVSQLDSKLDLSGNKFYVYRCQHANAGELSEVLAGLTGEGGNSSGSQTGGSGSDLFGGDNTGMRGGGFGSSSRSGLSRSGSSSRFGSQSRLQDQSRTPGRSRNEGQGKSTPKSVNFGENISITADPATNSLIIHASKADYQKILELLQSLDIKRKQVLVEAMLLEVGVDDNANQAFDFLGSTGGKDGGVVATTGLDGNLANLFKDPTKIAGFSIAAASAGSLKLGNNITIPTQSVLLNAAKSNSNVNVLSAPTILATDNEQAEIVVGENVPFLASTATSGDNLNNTFNQIDRQDVGITLRLTPQISSGETVKLAMFTEVSALVPEANSSLGPRTTVRTSDTTVIAKDGQMIVIGGLMADKVTDGETGVPFLKDVPILGQFFKRSQDGRSRNNLLIFITPRIIKDQFDARDVTITNRDKIEDVIASDEVYPRREEVLRNIDIDRVSEAPQYSGSKPSTILAPDEKHVTTSASGSVVIQDGPPPIKAPATNAQPSDPANQNAPIELRVTPRLPDTKEDAPIARLEGSAPHVDTAGIYVVLEAGKGAKVPPGLPFALHGARHRVVLMIPAESSRTARRFFQVGSTFGYDSGSSVLPLKPIGVFNSPSEAKQMFKDLGKDWYVLSPYEIMNIGQGPWVKAE